MSRPRRRALAFLAGALAGLLLERALAAVMAHAHVAHELLGAGASGPGLGTALVAVAFVVIRLLAVVLAPGLGLAAATWLVGDLLRSRFAPADREDGRSVGEV